MKKSGLKSEQIVRIERFFDKVFKVGEIMKKIVIQQIPNLSYFQWFLLGLYDLEESGEIKLEIKDRLVQILKGKKSQFFYKYVSYVKDKCFSGYNLRGYLVNEHGYKKYFCIDCGDAPYLFNEKDLKICDIYFKMQCPIDLESDNFELVPGVNIPWSAHEHVNEHLSFSKIGERKIIRYFHKYSDKIRPLMVGPRLLAKRLDYEGLREGYQRFITNQLSKKNKKIMAYFGDAKGPKPFFFEPADFNNEANIMDHFKDKIEHPNVKRQKASDFLSSLGEGYDARVINQGNSDSLLKNNVNLTIPLETFPKFVSQFQYNLNISGYRCSIPNRFIDSFSVGTKIITDKLKVKWYLPFDGDVIETVEMGYLRDSEVNWDIFKKDILSLPESKPKQVIENFENKWSPKVVAKYMVNKLLDSF